MSCSTASREWRRLCKGPSYNNPQGSSYHLLDRTVPSCPFRVSVQHLPLLKALCTMADRGGEASTSSWQMFQQRALHAASQECGASGPGRRYNFVLDLICTDSTSIAATFICCSETILKQLASQVLPTGCRGGSSCTCSATSATEKEKEDVRPHVSPAPLFRLSLLPWCCWLPLKLTFGWSLAASLALLMRLSHIFCLMHAQRCCWPLWACP